MKKIKNKMEEDLRNLENLQVKIISIEKRSSFLIVSIECDGGFYEGLLIKGGFKKDENIKKDDDKEKN